MAFRGLAFVVFLLPQVRSWLTDAHGSRELFSNPSNVSLQLDFNKTRLYTSGVIVGEVSHNETARISTCRFTEVRNDAEREWLYKKLGREPEKVDFDSMMALIEDCGVTVVGKRRFPRFLNPVFPGTVWCGPGDSAVDYETLGLLPEQDACCRNHDLCPIRALPGEALTPKGPNLITVSDCRCDHALKTCLEKSAKKNRGLIAGTLRVLMEMSINWCFDDDGTITTPGFKSFNFH